MLTKEFLDGLERLIAVGEPVTSASVALQPDALARVMVSLPAGRKTEDLTSVLLAMESTPRGVTGEVVLTALDSLIAFTQRMRLSSSVLFAKRSPASITAVFDYHQAVNHEEEEAPGEKGGSVLSLPDVARWGRFRASFAFPVSRQWAAWTGSHQRVMGQQDLADFLEENIRDVINESDCAQDAPTATLVSQLGLRLGTREELLRTARGLVLHSDERVTQIINTSSGETQVVYEQTHAGQSADVRIPTAFLIAVPVFEGDAYYRLLVRLRHRKVEHGVRWAYDIYAMDRAVDDAFTTACRNVAEQTGLPLFYGEPPKPQGAV